MDTTIFAGMTKDGSVFVDDFKFVSVGRDADLLDWYDSDDGEEGTGGFVALGAAAGMVVKYVAADRDFHWIIATFTV